MTPPDLYNHRYMLSAEQLEYHRRWRANNPNRIAKINARRRENRRRNAKPRMHITVEERKSIKAAIQRRYYARTAERQRAWAIAYRIAHPEQLKESNRRWHLNNPHRARFHRYKRRAAIRGGSVGSVKAVSKWERNWRTRKSVRCYWCSGRFSPESCHTDHVNPLARGGAHSIENLCIACQSCNYKKKAKLLSDWNRFLENPVLL